MSEDDEVPPPKPEAVPPEERKWPDMFGSYRHPPRPPKTWKLVDKEFARPVTITENGKRRQGTVFEAILLVLRGRKIEVEVDGKKKKLWRDEIINRQLANQAINGDIGAALTLMERHARSKAGGDYKGGAKYVSEKEAKFMRILQRRRGR